MRLPNVSINRKVLHQIFQNKCLITKDISKDTFKALDFLSNVIEMNYKSKKLPENRRSPEAIQMQSDMSHMRKSVFLFDVQIGPKNTDHTVSFLFVTIQNIQDKHPRINRVHIFMDNASSTNKNK